jgi:hypothetical protein
MVANRIKREIAVVLPRLATLVAEGKRFIRESSLITGLVSRQSHFLQELRCQTCRLRGLPRYRIDFNPYSYGEFRLPRKPSYACRRCLAKYETDPEVLGVRRVLG